MLALGLIGLAWAEPALAQTVAPGNGHLYILPGPAAETGTDAPITLTTHTVDVRLGAPDGASNGVPGPLPAQVSAVYRLQNPNRTPVALVLSIAPLAEADLGPVGKSQSPATNVVLQAAGQPLALQPSLDRPGYVTQITVPGDGRLDLRLTYDLALGSTGGGAALTAIAYPVFPLNQWSGGPGSLRVSLFLPTLFQPENWLRTEPDGWTFDGSELRWLYESRLPSSAIVFQSVHPALWQEVTNARRLAVPGAPAAAFLDLAAGFRQIYIAPTLDEPDRRSFYAQALAALTEGLTNAQATAAPAQDMADLHMGLADLYRSQAVGETGRVDLAYVDLTLGAVQQALTAAPTGTPTHAPPQMHQWLLESLRLKLSQAQTRQDWAAASDAVEALAALPGDLVDPAVVAQERRAIVLQQAIQLLNQDNQEAAIALAGPQIARTDLAPPAQVVSLIRAWQVGLTVTVETGNRSPRTALRLSGRVAAGQEEAALAAGQKLAGLWADSQAQVQTELGTDSQGQPVLILSMRLPDGTTGPGMAPAALLAGPEWNLLRTLLSQTIPQSTATTATLWQEVDLSQRLDLRPAADQWRALAGDLRSQAAQLEATSSAGLGNTGDAALAEQVIQDRIRAANYRSAAQVWQGLADNSQIFVTLELGDDGAAATRSWVVTPQDAPATMHLTGRTLDRGRVILAGGGLILILLLLAGLLWRLM